MMAQGEQMHPTPLILVPCLEAARDVHCGYFTPSHENLTSQENPTKSHKNAFDFPF